MKPKNQTLTSKIAFALLACSAALTARGDYPSTVLSQGPVAYYRLSETTAPPPPVSATNLGSLGTAFNGTYNNDSPRGLPGPLTGGDGSAVSFDGVNQTVQTAYDPALNPTSFTIEAWLNPLSSSVSGGLLCALASMHSASPRSGWLIYQSDTVANGGVGAGWDFRMYNQNGSATSVSVVGATNMTAGTWYHVVCTYDDSSKLASVYVDGVLVGSATATGFVPNPDAVFSIGARSDNGFLWKGKASEVAYYSTVLSSNQVVAHYNAAANGATYPTTVLADAPIAYYRLNEPGDPVAPNLGTLGSAADAAYVYNAQPGQPGPESPAFPGFDAANKGVTFDGNSGYVKIPPLNLNTNTVTMTAWVNLAGVNNPNAGIIYQDSGATQAGLKFDVANANGLSYNWSSDVAANFNSTLVVPSTPQWAFVALITAADHAVLAVQDGTSFQYVTNFLTLGPLPFSGPTLIGSDGGSATLTFNGTIDEVAIFNRSLGLGEVYTEYAAGAGTNAPIVFLDPQAPVNSVYTGDTLDLTVDAGGTPPLFYQWKKGTTAISGATSSAFIIPSVTNSDSATYSVVVSNAYGSATSAGAIITVNSVTAPQITQGPVGRTLYPGGTLDLTVVATGGALSYQWSKNSTAIPSATSSAYIIASVVTNDSGNYSVLVSNRISTAPSGAAAVTVISPVAGTFEAAITTDTPEAWWRLNDAPSSTVMADALGRHDGQYVGGVTLGSPGLPQGSSTSATFDGSSGYASAPYSPVLNSEVFTVEAWVHTSDVTSEMGVFSSFSTGSGSPYKGKGYFMQRTGADIFSGGIGLNDQYSYYFVNLGENIAGKWSQVAVTYGSGGLSYWQDGALSSGGYGDFARNSTSPFLIGTVYPGIDDWWWNGEIADVIYYKTNLSAAQINAHYQAALYGTSSKPIVITQPVDQTVVVGNSVTFTALAEGSTPLSLQWLKDNTPVAGATNGSLTIPKVFFTDAGNYQLMATNSLGASNSVTVKLTVLAVPQFVDATNNLVLHLTFDGNYNDTSGRGNNGTAVGSPDFVPGIIGSEALHYSTFTTGNASGGAVTNANYVTLGVAPDLQFSSNINFSVSFWIRVPSNSLSGDLPYFGDTLNSFGGQGIDLAPSYKTGGWSWSMNGTTVTATGAGGSINNGKWHSLIYTFDRTGNAVTYLDGVAVDTTPDSGGGDVDTGQPTTIGQDPSGGYTEPGEADIDDLGVWTRALSSYEAYAINYVGQNYGRTFDVVAPVQITLQPINSGYGISWQAGTLQSATSLSGPWTTVVGASAPFYPFSAAAGTQFYRVKVQ